MAKSVVELNGQLYDTITGKRITTSSSSTTAHPKKVASPAVKNLDGFSRRPTAAKPPVRSAATPVVHQKPQKSSTLMRAAVKKPAKPAKIHAKAPATSPVSAAADSHHDTFAAHVKPGRALRASHTPQSSLISKFGAAANSIRSEILPVKTPPVAAHKVSAPAPAKTPKTAMPAPKAAAKAAPAKPDRFKAAIEQSTSHQQPKLKKPKLHHKVARKLRVSPRVVSFASFTLIALGISAFVAYQNLPELAMRVAATRAGLSASLPTYQPSGYAMAGPIQYQPGEVTVNYKSTSDQRTFDVTQKNSSWNSETLLENYVTTSGKPYQTFQSNGRTIYIYDGNKATWVDGGIWYNVDGKSNLNSDQLLRIAGSLQ